MPALLSQMKYQSFPKSQPEAIGGQNLGEGLRRANSPQRRIPKTCPVLYYVLLETGTNKGAASARGVASAFACVSLLGAFVRGGVGWRGGLWY